MTGLISIIIPLYNQAHLIDKCLSSIKKQTYPFKDIQIIIVNNASDDGGEEVCRRYEQRYDNIVVKNTELRSVSLARNTGINFADGKYIFFLDADDCLSKNTIKDCIDVFDSIYNEVDLLTYPIETHYKGSILEPHFRYRYLKENGVYDLTKDAFIGQTTMNIVVKNKFDYNVLFDESMDFSEDQKYCCDVTRDKLKIGFCKTAKYIYNRSEEGASGRLSGACYIFESSLKMFEDLFSAYEHVPVAYQGLFINDIYWKMLSNILFPYHYDSARYNEAIARIKALLRKCYNYVILEHPNFDYYEKFYLLRMKGEDTISLEMKKDEIAMYSEGYDVFRRKDIEMVITKVQIEGDIVRIYGFLKSVFFQFYHGSVELYAIENENYRNLMDIYPSVHDYYRSHEPTQCFYAVQYEGNVNLVHEMRFELKLGETILPVGYYIMPLVPFSKEVHTYRNKGIEIDLRNRKWSFSKYMENDHKKTWLYYDCVGVDIDNGLEQYAHDLGMNDGVRRYYVLTDRKQLPNIPTKGQYVKFGSSRHKKLLLEADKIVTAFIENNNLFPWPSKEYGLYANQFHFDTIYLQHGVLHIDMPWKYSPEKIIADKIVVASDVDYNLFRKNGYCDKDLWKIGFPRFANLKRNNHKSKRILYAPSWRSYLVSSDVDDGWKVLPNKFYSSKYYMGIKAFLESDELSRILAENGYALDVKMHPIFMDFDLQIACDQKLISFVDEVKVEDYTLFITDFSSFMFDFLYIDIPILSFIPDFDEFSCGMNGYRKVDFIDKVKDSDICKSPNEIIDSISNYFENWKGIDYHVDFYKFENSSMDKVYEMISKME